MSFTVLRVEVQQWKDEGISLPAGGQSEEGVETYDVVEEAGHQEDCGNFGMRDTVLSVFIFRAERHRILLTLFVDLTQRDLTRVIISTLPIVFTDWFVEFVRQVNIVDYFGSRMNNVQYHDGQDRGHLHLYHLILLF